MGDLPTSTLEDMCEFVIDCPHFTPEWTDSGFIVIRNQNIRDGHLDLGDPSFKSVSQPPEESLRPSVDQKALTARILELTRNGKVNSADATRFKYLIAHVEPTSRLNARLMKVLHRHPELAPAICGYISRYNKIPRKLAGAIIEYLNGLELYHSVNGHLLRACLGRFPALESDILGRFCCDRLIRPKKGSIPAQPTYKEALIAWALRTNRISFDEYKKIVFQEPDWWVRKSALRELTSDLFGSATYADFVNRCARIQEGEVARIAASRIIQESVKLSRPYGDVETTAKQMLKAAKVIRVVGQPESRINEILSYITSRKATNYDWTKFFGNQHHQAEKMAILLKRDKETNINAFLVQLDSYCDLVMEQIFQRLKPGKIYPKFGVAIGDHNLISQLPNVMACFSKLHALRLESTTAHPRSNKTGQPTRRLKHKDYYGIRKDLVDAFDELERKITP